MHTRTIKTPAVKPKKINIALAKKTLERMKQQDAEQARGERAVATHR